MQHVTDHLCSQDSVLRLCVTPCVRLDSYGIIDLIDILAQSDLISCGPLMLALEKLWKTLSKVKLGSTILFLNMLRCSSARIGFVVSHNHRL